MPGVLPPKTSSAVTLGSGGLFEPDRLEPHNNSIVDLVSLEGCLVVPISGTAR